MTALRISNASEATGLPATTLRYWEQIGLIRSARTDAGYRIFDEHTIERLRFIRAAKRLDLPLDMIRELLRTWDNDTCRSVKQRLRPMVMQRLAQAENSIAELMDLTETLCSGLARLDLLPDRDTPCNPDCSFLDAPAPDRAETLQPIIACSLTGKDHAERLARWHSLLAAAEITRAELVTTVDLDTARAADVVKLIQREQECCPFLGFRLDFHGSTTVLTITAPNAAAESFVDVLLPEPTR